MKRSIRKKTKKLKYPQISLSDITIVKPNYRVTPKIKSSLIYEWFKKWLKAAKDKYEKTNDTMLLPLKANFAYYLGVSVGTIQTTLRQLEDEGIVSSKQGIGTFINFSEKAPPTNKKMISIRSKVTNLVKKYILDNNLKKGDSLPSMVELSKNLNITRSLLRSALGCLETNNYVTIEKNGSTSNRYYLLKNIEKTEINENSQEDKNLLADTLVLQTLKNMEQYFIDNYKVGDTLEPLHDLAVRFNVSPKTVYDARKILIDKGIVKTRRGNYGSILIKLPNDTSVAETKEHSIFANSQDIVLYRYERIENYIKNDIIENYEVGDKYLTIRKLAQKLDVSNNTVKSAIHNLAKQGYVKLTRGKLGGTYVIDIPETTGQSFKWIAVNPKYIMANKK